MYLGKVVGNVVCSHKDESLTAKKLLLVERLYSRGTVVAVDAVGAGAGETVYVCRGKEASFAFKGAEIPTEAAIVAIVDDIQIEDRGIGERAGDFGDRPDWRAKTFQARNIPLREVGTVPEIPRSLPNSPAAGDDPR